MNLEKIKSLWPIRITPLIDGVEIVYDTAKGTFVFDNKIFHINFGRKTYGPIKGYLTITQIELERMNYKRAQAHLELFSTIQEAVSYILNTKIGLKFLIFVAQGIISNFDILVDETSLLKRIGYNTVRTYTPDTPEKALEFLTYFSTLQTQEARNQFFKMNKAVVFNELYVEGTSERFIFSNDNLAVAPENLKIKLSSDYDGNILAYYTFNPITILGTTFNTYKDLYFKGLLKSFTLINQKPKAFYDASKKNLLDSCPVCHQKLDVYRCINPYCKSKIVHKAHQIASREALNITGLSKNMLSLMYDYLRNNKVSEERIHELYFFYLNTESIQEFGIKEMQIKLLSQSIWQAAEKQKLSTLIYSLNIPGIDKQQAQIISDTYEHNIDNLICAIERGDSGLSLFIPKLKNLKLFKSYIFDIY